MERGVTQNISPKKQQVRRGNRGGGKAARRPDAPAGAASASLEAAFPQSRRKGRGAGPGRRTSGPPPGGPAGAERGKCRERPPPARALARRPTAGSWPPALRRGKGRFRRAPARRPEPGAQGCGRRPRRAEVHGPLPGMTSLRPRLPRTEAPRLVLCSASFLRLSSQQGLGAVTAFPVLSWPFGSRHPDAPGVVGAERPPPLASPRPAPFLWMGLSSPEDAERCPQRLPRAVGRTRHRAGRVVGPLLSPRHPSSLAPRSWVSGVLRHSSGRPRSGHC